LRKELTYLVLPGAFKAKITLQRQSTFEKQTQDIRDIQAKVQENQTMLAELTSTVAFVTSEIETAIKELTKKESALKELSKAAATAKEALKTANHVSSEKQQHAEGAEQAEELVLCRSKVLLRAHREIGLTFTTAMRKIFKYKHWEVPDCIET
jgi:DNA repair exonuclease SbcCD ATPase subunit